MSTSPLPYIGGKSRLAKTIIARIPEHDTYCEVFAGACWVFFQKEPSKYEIINDLDSELVAFYRVLQNHLEEFLRQFRWLISSREWFEDYKRQSDAGGLTDIQRAARFYYVQRHAFAGRPRNPSFGSNPLNHPRINLLRMEEELSAVHLRLCRVTVENLPWEVLIERYDRPTTVLYLDPPYWNRRDYKHNLVPDDYRRMADILSRIKGRFLLSIDDRPETRETFDRFKIEQVTTMYSASGSHQKRVAELLITNT